MKSEMVTAPLANNSCFTFEQLNVISIFQRLFNQLAAFMRGTINASIFNNPNLNENLERLMRVPGDFRNSFLLFYGPEIANRMNDLMTSYIANVVNVVEGYKSNNQDLLNRSVQKWYNDANNLSSFLGSINLFWDVNQWRNLFYQYIQLKLEMIVALFSKDFGREIAIYDRIFDVTTIMGTYMARGLIAREIQRTENQ
jgi:hypothetical protein